MAAAADDNIDMEKLTLSDDMSVRAATQDQLDALKDEGEKKLKASAGHTGKLSYPGRMYGWYDTTAILKDNILRFYSSSEDIALDNPQQTLDVGGCQASLSAAGKHGRDHAIEVVIANPRSVQVVAADTADAAEEWVKVLNAVKAVEQVQEGHAGNLSDEQNKALGDLKAALGDEVNGRTDADLLRFLRASEWVADKAKVLWTENEIWRKQFNVDNLTVNYCTRELRTGKMRLLPSKDKLGRPICVGQPGRHNPKESSPLEVSKLFTYNMELAVKSMKDNVEQCVFVMDFKGMSPRAVDLRVPRVVLETLQQRYPDRVGLILIVNAPWFFRFIWATVRNFLSESLLKKVHILGSNMQTLQAFVPPEALLQEHGGTIIWEAEEFIRARAKEEGVTVSDGAGAMDALEGGIDQSLLATLRQMPCKDASNGAVKTGYLTKLGGVVKNWKKRFFVLSESGLFYYYKDNKSSSPQGVVLLERSTVGDSTEKAHAFEVVTPLRTYVICASNDAERDEWKKAVQNVCASL